MTQQAYYAINEVVRKKSSLARRRALGLHVRVREAREAAGFTSSYVAGKLRIDPSVYLRLERGEIAVTAERVVELAEILGTTIAALYGTNEARAS